MNICGFFSPAPAHPGSPAQEGTRAPQHPSIDLPISPAPAHPGSPAQEGTLAPQLPSTPTSRQIRRERLLLLGVLMTALVHGLIYVFVMPPWQHYEEPAHFEYAWMIAEYAAGNRSEFPGYADYDQDMRRKIAASMIEHDFFRELNFLPDLEAEGPVWIGLGQAGTQPGLHILMTVPLKLFAKSGVEVQLYAARMLSLVLFLLCIWFAYIIVGEFTQPGNPLRLLMPLAMALHPGFVDLMTALNDDVGATFGFSLFLLLGVLMLKRGFSTPRLVAMLGLAVLCYFTKVTVVIAIPLAFLALILVLFRKRSSPFLWLLLFAAGVAGILLTLRWGDAAKWYRQTEQNGPTRTILDNVPHGDHAFILSVPACEGCRNGMSQRIPEELLEILRGKVITFGAWVWAVNPIEPGHFTMKTLSQSIPLAVSREPIFQAFQLEVPADQGQMDVRFQLDGGRESISVYFDGVVLVKGEQPVDQPPVFRAQKGKDVIWDGVQVENHIRNASAEDAWPYVRPVMERVFRDMAGSYLVPSILLGSVLDWENSAWLYEKSAVNLFQTFWARFGWAHIFMDSGVYWILAGATGMGFLGAGLSLWSVPRGKSRPWRIALAWLGIAVGVIWVSAVFRGFFTTLGQSVYIPTARYAFPAMIPTSLVLVAGWRRLSDSRIVTSAIIMGYLVLDFASILTIINYYG